MKLIAAQENCSGIRAELHDGSCSKQPASLIFGRPIDNGTYEIATEAAILTALDDPDIHFVSLPCCQNCLESKLNIHDNMVYITSSPFFGQSGTIL